MESIEQTPNESTAVTISTLWNKGKLFLKCAVIFFMALVLWIPTNFILDLVKERKERQKEAIADISSKWAGKQTITGPLLNIPYDETAKDEKGNTVTIKRNLWFMPDKLDIKTKVYPEKRHRGIYKVAVYRSDISLNVKFNPLKWQDLKYRQKIFIGPKPVCCSALRITSKE